MIHACDVDFELISANTRTLISKIRSYENVLKPKLKQMEQVTNIFYGIMQKAESLYNEYDKFKRWENIDSMNRARTRLWKTTIEFTNLEDIYSYIRNKGKELLKAYRCVNEEWQRVSDMMKKNLRRCTEEVKEQNWKATVKINKLGRRMCWKRSNRIEKARLRQLIRDRDQKLGEMRKAIKNLENKIELSTKKNSYSKIMGKSYETRFGLLCKTQ